MAFVEFLMQNTSMPSILVVVVRGLVNLGSIQDTHAALKSITGL